MHGGQIKFGKAALNLSSKQKSSAGLRFPADFLIAQASAKFVIGSKKVIVCGRK